MRRTVAILAGLLGVFVLSAWVGAQSERGNPKAGQTIYEQHCLHCHGMAGDGNGPDAAFLVVAPANFQSARSRSKTDVELMNVIMYGVVFSPMHGWGGRLTEQQMWDVLSYIRALVPFNPVAQTAPGR
jgi:mono/diheme cytochrome c family protein